MKSLKLGISVTATIDCKLIMAVTLSIALIEKDIISKVKICTKKVDYNIILQSFNTAEMRQIACMFSNFFR